MKKLLLLIFCSTTFLTASAQDLVASDSIQLSKNQLLIEKTTERLTVDLDLSRGQIKQVKKVLAARLNENWKGNVIDMDIQKMNRKFNLRLQKILSQEQFAKHIKRQKKRTDILLNQKNYSIEDLKLLF